MKKIVYTLLLILTLAIMPTDTVEATNKKVEKPTVSVTYSTKKHCWYLKFKHNDEDAVIYYKRKGFKTDKWSTVKPGKKIKATKFEEYGIQYFAKVDGEKSTKKTTYLETLYEAKTRKDIKKTLSPIISENDTDFNKLIKLIDFCNGYFRYTFNFEHDYYGYNTFYDKGNVCQGLSQVFILMCDVIGLDAEYVSTYSADYDYRDNHAWVHVHVNNTLVPLEVSSTIRRINDIRDDIGFIKTAKYDLTGKGLHYLHGENYYSVIECIFADDIDHYILEDNKITFYYNDYDECYGVATYDETKGHWNMADYYDDGTVDYYALGE